MAAGRGARGDRAPVERHAAIRKALHPAGPARRSGRNRVLVLSHRAGGYAIPPPTGKTRGPFRLAGCQAPAAIAGTAALLAPRGRPRPLVIAHRPFSRDGLRRGTGRPRDVPRV